MRAAIYTGFLLVILCCLLAVATSAPADCAWVLWNTYLTTQTEPKNLKAENAAKSAFESQRLCEQAIQAELRSHIKTWSTVYDRVNVSPVDPVVVVAKGLSRTSPPREDDSLMVRVSC